MLPTIRAMPSRRRKIPTGWLRLIRLLPITDGKKQEKNFIKQAELVLGNGNWFELTTERRLSSA
jgi:hypothetical protein